MLDVFDVASYFINKQEAEAGDAITNLKLQKLLYYAQGCSLALRNEPLFSDSVVRWKCGPVVESVYTKFKDYNVERIPFQSLNLDVFDKNIVFLLDTVYTSLGRFAAWMLKDLSMKTFPFTSTKMSDAIDHETMKEFFKTQIIRVEPSKK